MKTEHIVSLSEQELRTAIITYVEARGEIVPDAATVRVNSQHVMRGNSTMGTEDMATIRWGGS